MPLANPLLPSDYGLTLKTLQERIRRVRARAILSANSALVSLYWEIGHTILERQTREGWGAKVIDRLARDLRRSFPAMQGFSPRNLQFMRAFAEQFPDALRDLNKPIGVAGWETTLARVLPENLAGMLPSVEELAAELGAGE